MATNTEKIVVQVVVKGQGDLKNLESQTNKTTLGFNKMTAGIVGAVATFRQINKIVSDSVKTFRDFEFQMAKVKAITGASNKDFLKLSKTSQELGRSTFFTAQQVAQLQTNFGKLGFSTKEILKAQKATLNLATATDTDLARAAIVAGAAVRGFSLDASETQRVADVMAVAFTSSALDIEKFQTSMTKVSPIAAGANISLEATTAVMGTLTDAGIEASIAGTSLRNIFLKMQDPASDLSKHLGFTVNSSDDLQKALKQLNDEGLSNAQMMQLVDLRQVAAFQTMINGSKNISDLTFELEQGTGAADEMAGIVGDNLEGAFKRLTSAFQGLQIVVTESVFGKGLQEFIDGTAKLFNNFTSFIEEPIEETLDKDRIAMNALAMETMQLAEGTDERRLAIIELQKKYPEYFANLDSEKTKNDELKTSLESANEQYIQRIVLRKKEAEMAAVAEQAAEQFNIADEESNKARQAAIKLNEDYSLGLDISSMSLEEARKAVTNLMVAQSDYTDDADPTLLTLTKSAKKAEVAKKRYDDLTVATGDLRDEYKKLKDEFGFKDDEETTTTTNNGGGDGSIIDKFAEETALLEQKLRQDLNLEKEALLEGTIDKELFDLIKFELEQAHLQKMLDLSLKYGEDTSAIQSQMLDNEINRIETVAKAEAKANSDAEKDRKKQISDLDSLGKSLITMAGEEKKLQGIKKLGIKVTAAATLATNLNTIANAKNAITKAAGEPFPASLIAIVSVLAAMLSATKSAQTIAEFAKGGMIEEFANGGMVHGKSHANGGEKFAVGGRVVELEGGEAVINKRSTSMFRNQLSAMNAAGGGVKFADGGLMNMPSFAQSQFSATSQAGMMGAIGQGGRVVVVESDISTVQNTVSVIEAEATI
jgi:TP901 family phage tail tape measure protein